jgi:DNA-binding FadR family transcriptional regulator
MLATRHRQLLDAIESRDPEAAMRAMQHHIEDLGKPPEALDKSASLMYNGR